MHTFLTLLALYLVFTMLRHSFTTAYDVAMREDLPPLVSARFAVLVVATTMLAMWYLGMRA